MRLIDTHCHLYLDDFKADIAEVITRARTAGVEKFFLPNIDSASIPDLFALEAAYPGICFAMMGLHPCSVGPGFQEELTTMAAWLEKRSFVAIGEIGLDFFWDTTFVDAQYEALHTQVGWAKQYGLPVIIHSRKSLDECIAIIREHQDGNLKGIFHCFSGSIEQANQVVDLGFYLGIGGVVTYKNGGLGPVIREFGLDPIVLETDAPYLTPVPNRGKRNEPAYLVNVVNTLSQMLDKSPAEVALVTAQNAEKIFGS
jgi:TatD DNase family protein